MKRIADDFKGVIYVGKTQFIAGKDIPEEFMEKMDLDSLIDDGVVVDDEKETASIAFTGDEPGEGTALEDMTRAELLAYANEELQLGIPVRSGKEIILEKIQEALEQKDDAHSSEDPDAEGGEDQDEKNAE